MIQKSAHVFRAAAVNTSALIFMHDPGCSSSQTYHACLTGEHWNAKAKSALKPKQRAKTSVAHTILRKVASGKMRR